MRSLHAGLVCLAMSAPWILPGAGSAAGDGLRPGPDVPDRQGEVLVEGGLALPLGDLGAGFAHTRRGMAAGIGHHMGLRVRFYPARTLAAAPSFTHVQFGLHEGLSAGGEAFTVQAAILRYGLDLLYQAPGRAMQFRPFLGVGLAFVRNKYREEFPDSNVEFVAGVNNLVGSLVAGVRWDDWDVSLAYEINRFTTGRLSHEGEPLRYRWNSVLLRVGYALPRF